jgi:hypothetical protein
VKNVIEEAVQGWLFCASLLASAPLNLTAA